MTTQLMSRIVMLAALVVSVGCKKSAPETAVPAASAASAIPASLNAAAPILNAVGVAVPGLSQAQQILSTASLFGVAKQKMPADQWEQVASSVPGADALAQEAVRQGLPSNVNGVAGLNEFLGKSGITPEQLNKVAPAVAKSLQGKVTPEVATSFVNSLR